MTTLIDPVTFTGAKVGPRFLVLGAVHGNEKCGTYAIQRVLEELKTGKWAIESGMVTFVPICNKAAFDADTREIARNLNRFLVPHQNPQTNEEKIGNELCPLLEKCDYLLDLHSYHNGKGSYIYVGKPGSDEHKFANCLGADAGITGWPKAYANSGRSKDQPDDPNEPIGTTEYARRFCAIAATIECGQHKDVDAPEVAYRAIRNALRFLGMNTSNLDFVAHTTNAKLIELQNVIWRGEGGDFVRDWGEMDRVKTGEVIAHDANGKPLTAPADGYIILPNRPALPDKEWYYFGTSI